MTGLETLPDLPILDYARRNIARYILQYGFEFQGASSGEQQARVEFDPNAIRELIRAANLPLWTAYRPTVGLWITETDWVGSKSIIFREQIETNLDLKELSRAADERGIELKLASTKRYKPSGSASFEEIVPFGGSVELFAHEHNADIVILVDVIETSFGDLSVRMKGVYGENILGFRVNVASLGLGLRYVVNRVANELAKRYAVAGERANLLELTVEGVDSLDTMLSVQKYLQKWEFVERIDLVLVDGTAFTYRLHTPSSMAQFKVFLADDGQLVPIDEGQSQHTFEWLVEH